jgi:transketolase
VTLVGAGVTLFECLKAADELEAGGTPARVVDAYSVKPIDRETLQRALAETGLIVVVEDHWPEGGLGDAVLSALAEGARGLSGRVVKLAVSGMPGSAPPDEQRRQAGIASANIVAAVKAALSQPAAV